MRLRGTGVLRGLIALAISAAAHAAPPGESEIEVRDALHRQGAQLLLGGDYADADRVLGAYRNAPLPSPAGDSRLRLLLEGIETPGLLPDDPQWTLIENRTSDWISTHPDSPTAVIMAAAALLAHAEAWRAGRYIDTMAPAEQAAMRALLERARSLLDAWPGLAAQAADWTWVRLHIARAAGEDPAVRLQLALEGLRRRVADDLIHDAAISALAPKWGGETRLQRRYIDTALRRQHGDEGAAVAARLYSLVLRSARSRSSLQDELRRAGATWPELQRSFDALIASRPEPWNRALYRSFACVYGDRERFLMLNAGMGDTVPAIAALDTPAWRAACRAWAEGRLGSALPSPDVPAPDMAEPAVKRQARAIPMALGVIALLAVPVAFRLWRWRRATRRGRRG